MHKNKLFKLVFKVLIILFSYGYIYFKYKSSHLDWNTFESIDIKYFLIAILLMPFNWFIEAAKWQYLLKDIQQIPFSKSIKGVLIGITSGMATPNRIGEYVGRTYVLNKHNKVKGSLATMLGSLSQIMITLIVGMFGWFLLFNQIRFFEHPHYRPIFFSLLVTLMIFLILIYYNLKWIKNLAKWLTINQKYIDEIRFLSKYKAPELSFIIFLSFFRYVVFASQYILLLKGLQVNIPLISSLSAIAVIFLIIVFIPHFSITELGVRSSIAVLIFQNFTNQLHLVAVTAAILWLINLAIPTLVGSTLFFRKKQ